MRLHANSTTARLLDYLETFDGCWFTTQNLKDTMSDMYGTDPGTTRIALARLLSKGLVERRDIEVNGTMPQGALTRRAPSPGVQTRLQVRVPDRRWLDSVYGT